MKAGICVFDQSEFCCCSSLLPDVTQTQYPLFNFCTCLQIATSAPAVQTRPRVELQQASVASVLGQIQAIVQGMLGMLPPADQPLMEAGLDSLGAVELRAQLERVTGAELPATVMFDYPSMGAMASFIASLIVPHQVCNRGLYVDLDGR